ncbi:unnamed protein product [Sphagnum tenellum]
MDMSDASSRDLASAQHTDLSAATSRDWGQRPPTRTHRMPAAETLSALTTRTRQTPTADATGLHTLPAPTTPTCWMPAADSAGTTTCDDSGGPGGWRCTASVYRCCMVTCVPTLHMFTFNIAVMQLCWFGRVKFKPSRLHSYNLTPSRT